MPFGSNAFWFPMPLVSNALGFQCLQFSMPWESLPFIPALPRRFKAFEPGERNRTRGKRWEKGTEPGGNEQKSGKRGNAPRNEGSPPGERSLPQCLGTAGLVRAPGPAGPGGGKGPEPPGEGEGPPGKEARVPIFANLQELPRRWKALGVQRHVGFQYSLISKSSPVAGRRWEFKDM